MRRVIIAGNWKMFKTINESIEMVNLLKRAVVDINDLEIVICPPFTSLSDVRELIMDTNIKLGAQDCYWEKEGAFTGEISVSMLKSAGCEYVIVGHSERRQFFGDTNETVNKKAKAALKEGLKPIVCVGEKLSDRQAGKTFDVVKDHVTNSLSGITGEEMLKAVIAYEPVWAIGTGVNATKDEAEEVHKYIRELLKKMYGVEISGSVRIQYGGSVKPDNIRELISEEDVDGALVGGASLKADSFAQIIKGCL
ncbi:MAG: triose-phosphate isomerase [Candidatus Omnitrophica bacterium]|nr:triose-phosphate isomerase [Candidatus Omnitrophota bacterium]MBU0881250.1 triose-phosphate isomerase [Candidatus Omnitrophota bacterium]MBU0895588.1 triose-phosphate isomerase [Candidatus Omnitrophota bacterium]MBU1809237.1 triose-phosphate isomerase [Candidatus Omnitrophota bacterium]